MINARHRHSVVISSAVLLPILNGNSFRLPVVWGAALTIWLGGL
jgi:hypothetical protein